MAEHALAIDIGGTKIAAGLVDAGGELVHTAKLPTPDTNDAEAIWAVAEQLIREAMAGRSVRGVGIASAGPIDLHAGTVSPINITAWQGFPIVDRVAATVPGVPMRLAGDGLCMALGERWRGAGGDASFLLGMVVSTGVGGGIVMDGRLFDGSSGNAGHVGHIIVSRGGPRCYCGGLG